MAKSRESVVRAIVLLVCCAVLTVCSIVILSQKEALFLDEYSSFGCSNSSHGKLMRIDDHVRYSSEDFLQEARETYGVNENERFRFDYVWQNMRANVHPPVFYALLHFVCSLTPGIYSIWQIAAVNIFFGLISLFFFQKFARAFTRSELTAGILCLGWVCTLGLYGNIVFLRDYAAAMCGILIAAWEYFRYLRGNRTIRDLVKIALASALSVLTHYYCVIALFFLCGTLCVILIIRKKWKAARNLVAAEAGAALLAAAVFPGMIRSLFFSNRSAESSGNLAALNLSQWKNQFLSFLSQLNRSFFGGLLLWAGLLILLLAAVSLYMRKKGRLRPANPDDLRPDTIILLLIPSACYFILISKIAPLSAFRYQYLVTTLLYLSLAALLHRFGARLLKPKALTLFLAAAVLAMSCFSWQQGSIRYLYRGTEQKIQNRLDQYRGLDAVIIRKTQTNPNALLMQAPYYVSLTFYHRNNDQETVEIPALREGKDIILIVTKSLRDERFVNRLLQDYPSYKAKNLGNLDGQYKFYNYYLHHTP